MQKRVTLYELKQSQITIVDPRYLNVQTMEPRVHVVNSSEVALGLAVNDLKVPIVRYREVINGYVHEWYVAIHPTVQRLFGMEKDKYDEMELALDNYKNASFLTKLRRLFT